MSPKKAKRKRGSATGPAPAKLPLVPPVSSDDANARADGETAARTSPQAQPDPNSDQPGPADQERLNENQRKAVEYGAGPLLVVAGAGTGKTKVITRRIAHLIEQRGVPPGEILAFTFTEKAATEMLDRLVGMGIKALPEHVSTFHAFGDWVLAQYSYEMGLPPSYDLLGEAGQVIFLEDHLDELALEHLKPKGRPAQHLSDLAKAIGRAKAEVITPEDYAKWVAGKERAVARESDPELKQAGERVLAVQRDIARAYAAYERLKDEHYLIDYGDQILKPLRLLRDNADIRQRLRERFRWILVDEYQDTNKAQAELIRQLTGPDGNLTAVGDDDQSIYAFQGARLGNILDFERTYRRPKSGQPPGRVVLTDNYRSSQPILDTAHRLISHNPDRLAEQGGFSKKLVARAVREQAAPQFLKFPCVTDEAEGIAKRLREHHKQGIPWEEMAVLVRKRHLADPIQRALRAAGVPFISDTAGKLYDQPAVKLAAHFLLAVADPHDSPALHYLCRDPLYGIPQDALFAAARLMRQRHEPLWDSLAAVAAEGRDTAAIERLQAQVREFAHRARDLPVDELCYEWLAESGLAKRLREDEDAAAADALGRLFMRLRQYAAAAADPTTAGWGKHYRDIVALEEERVSAEADADAQSVRVLTVHSAKGLEFEVVCVAGMVKGKFPDRRRTDQVSVQPLLGEVEEDEHKREERRLCYVALTRAARFLYLSASTDYLSKQPWRVSEFVVEALGGSVVGVMPDRPDDPWASLEQSAPVRAIVSPRKKEDVLRLSFSSLRAYWTCPWKYYWQFVAGFPEERLLQLEYGNLIHRVIEKINRTKLEGGTPDLAESLDWFRRGLGALPVASPGHRDQVKRSGEATIGRFFEEEKKRPAPTEVEREFAITLPGCVVQGRLDRVDRHKGALTIVDYKTGDSVTSQREADKRIRDAESADQLRLYSLAMLEETGAAPEKIVFNFVETGFAAEATPTKEQIETLRDKVAATAQAINAGKFEPNRHPHECSPFADCPGHFVQHRTKKRW